MPLAVGRWLPLSWPRRFIADLLHFAQQVPAATVERRMRLAPLVDARQACRSRPSWSILFARAFALVAARRPELRRSYQQFPWPHLYEHPQSVASITVERVLDGEEIPVVGHLTAPETQSLHKLNTSLQQLRSCPLDKIASFRRGKRFMRLPWPVRRLIWWAMLNAHGASRARFFGTFVVTSPAAHGAGVSYMQSPTTCSLHYGLFEATGSLDVRLTFDHRVFDGGPAARALTDLENVLLNQVVTEVRGIGGAQAA